MHRSRLILAAGFMLAVAACSGGDETTVDVPAETTTTEASVAAAPTTTTMAEPETTATTIPPDEQAPIAATSATYGHVVFTVQEALYSNARPGTFLDDAPEPGAERYLYVSFTADYEPDHPGRSDGFQTGDFALHLGDGTVITAEQVDFRRTLRVSVDDPLTHAWAFPGGSFDLSSATIVYDDATHLPVALDLGAGTQPSVFPIPFSVDLSADVSYDGGCTTGSGEVRVLDGEWDVDGGVDHDGKTMVNAGSARTVDDERFLRIRIQAIAQSGNCGGTVLTDDAFRLIVDGLPLGSINSHASKLDDGEGVELILAYRVPVDATDIAFEAGVSGETTEQFPIEIPGLTP